MSSLYELSENRILEAATSGERKHQMNEEAEWQSHRGGERTKQQREVLSSRLLEENSIPSAYNFRSWSDVFIFECYPDFDLLIFEISNFENFILQSKSWQINKWSKI